MAKAGYTEITAANIVDDLGDPLVAGNMFVETTDNFDRPISATAGGTTLVTGATTAGSTSVTGLSSTANLTEGQPISGAGIAANTVVAGVASGTLTLSQNATATGSGVALTVQTGGVILFRRACTPITNGAIAESLYVPDTALTRPANITYRITIEDETGEEAYVLRGVQPTGPFLNLDTYTPNVPQQAIVQYGPPGPPGPAGGLDGAPVSSVLFVDTADGHTYSVQLVNGVPEATRVS